MKTKTNLDRMEWLLEGFYQGHTSPEEEAELKAFFESDDVPEHWSKDRALFAELFLPETETPSYPAGRLESLIDGWAMEESSKTVPLETILSDPEPEHQLKPPRTELWPDGSTLLPETEQSKPNHKVLWPMTWRVAGIAASLFLMFSIGFHLFEDKRPMLTDTYSDPKAAYREVQKAMLMVSGNLNKGLDQLEVADEKVVRAEEILNANLR